MKINNETTFRFTATFPRFGAWRLDCVTPKSEKLLSGKVKVSDGIDLDGYVISAESKDSFNSYTIMPFQKILLRKRSFYASSRFIATEIARAIGVKVAECVDVPNVNFLILEEDLPLVALDALARSIGSKFRFDDQGGLYIVKASKDLQKPYKGAYRVLDDSHALCALVGLDKMDLRATQTIDGRPLSSVTIVGLPSGTRAIVTFS